MMRKLIPDSIATRTLLVLIIALTVSHLLSMGIFITERANALRFTGGEHTAERMATLAQLANASSPSERQRFAELADTPRLHVFWSADSAIEDGQTNGWKANVLRTTLADHLKTRPIRAFRLRYMEQITDESLIRRLHGAHDLGNDDQGVLASLQLTDGSWLNFATSVERPEPFWSLRFGLSMAVTLLTVVGLAVLVVKRLTGPLATFARAAEALGRNVNAAPLSENGPGEVRKAIRAFNVMQGRIRRFVEDRTQMLAAISHDLGTPITRLRLRAEFVEDPEQQRKMLADLDEMEKMVHASLSFARDETASEARALVDLRSLLLRVCDDLADAGHAVSLDAGESAVRQACQPAALRRALANLIENAVKYGHRARVALLQEDDAVLIAIDDDGPGIPEELREEAFRPFHRLEASRNKETGGTGLGLSMARTVIRAHGGDITLVNRDEGGLRATVRLPR